jgi:hypothetical protein
MMLDVCSCLSCRLTDVEHRKLVSPTLHGDWGWVGEKLHPNAEMLISVQSMG